MLEVTLGDELEHIQSMTINEAVAYTNRLIYRLNRHDCSDDEKKKGLILLERLRERARFLKITLYPT
jgi:hypothetical protein